MDSKNAPLSPRNQLAASVCVHVEPALELDVACSCGLYIHFALARARAIADRKIGFRPASHRKQRQVSIGRSVNTDRRECTGVGSDLSMSEQRNIHLVSRRRPRVRTVPSATPSAGRSVRTRKSTRPPASRTAAGCGELGSAPPTLEGRYPRNRAKVYGLVRRWSA